MKVVIAGGHGKIALRLATLLTGRQDDVVSIIRNPDHTADVEHTGAHPVLADLESSSVEELAGHLTGADAVVFAAGAGPNSGVQRKDTVDRGAAVLLADAAVLARVRRYLLISSMGAGSEPPEDTDEVFAAYLRAKTAAELAVAERDVDLTVLRPGALTDDAGTGLVTLAAETDYGEITRDDVAVVTTALLDEPRTAGLTLTLVEGPDRIDAAVAAVATRD